MSSFFLIFIDIYVAFIECSFLMLEENIYIKKIKIITGADHFPANRFRHGGLHSLSCGEIVDFAFSFLSLFLH